LIEDALDEISMAVLLMASAFGIRKSDNATFRLNAQVL
jgi:hypothetical protein